MPCYTPPHMAAKKTTLHELGEMLEHSSSTWRPKTTSPHPNRALIVASTDLMQKSIVWKRSSRPKINRLDTKLTKLEESEIDKRKQLEVRVAALKVAFSYIRSGFRVRRKEGGSVRHAFGAIAAVLAVLPRPALM
jgi:hypothetical protein